MQICLPRRWVGSSTIFIPPTSWGTVTILAGNMSWFCFQLILHQNDVKCFIELFSLTIYIVVFRIVLAGPFFPALMRSVFASGEGVSGPVVRPRVKTHARFITNGYLRMKHGHGRCNGIEMISRGSLNKTELTLSFFILYVV